MLKELLYPFDPAYLLENKRKIRKTLLESEGLITKKIAILGGYTTAAVRQMLELFLLNNGIRPEFYESEYAKFYEDAVFANPELEAFGPDVIYVCTSNRNIKNYPVLNDDEKTVTELLNNEYDRFEQIWKNLKDRYSCVIIQNNFEKPAYRLLGNKEASDIHGKVSFLNRLNGRFADYARHNGNFYICDIDYISADYGLNRWSDPFYFHMYKYALNVNAIPYLAFNVANIIKSLFGKNKKGFVLDLDNTLWGGVIGDDGVDGIKIGPEEAEGQFYSEFQAYVKEHKQLGIILNIDSKNEYDNALAGLNHPDSLLSQEDFVDIKANWEPKDQNFMQIAKELDLLPESLVFVDDNPAERHIVSEQLKGVCAPEIDMPRHFIEYLDRNGFFEVTTLSKDDLKRNEMYKQNMERVQAQAAFADYSEYLLSLQMKGTIRSFEPLYYERISQLSNKSNQFNLTTHRYTVSDIQQMAEDADHITIYGKLLDRFGDNGLISIVIGKIIDDVCDLDLWIMSCRVLKRDMEFAMMDELVRRCQARGISRIIGHYYPTAKNGMVKEFYGTLGFSKTSEDEAGNSSWEYVIPEEYDNQNKVIEVEHD